MRMLVDIGNTNTSIAFVSGKKIRKRYFIHTSRENINADALRRLFGPRLCETEEIVLVSVVPKFCSLMKRSMMSVAPNVPVRIVGKDVNVPIQIGYPSPSEIGQDRLVVAFAASRVYGNPVLVVDFGTALTFDLVNKNGRYEGGLIFPGLRLGAEALARNAALLPHVTINPVKGKAPIAKNTRDSINRGMLFGYAAACDGIIARFKKKYSRALKVIATGGDAALITRHSSQIKTVCPDLIFEGLLRL